MTGFLNPCRLHVRPFLAVQCLLRPLTRLLFFSFLESTAKILLQTQPLPLQFVMSPGLISWDLRLAGVVLQYRMRAQDVSAAAPPIPNREVPCRAVAL